MERDVRSAREATAHDQHNSASGTAAPARQNSARHGSPPEIMSKRAHGSSSHESHEERSIRKKTEKLRHCTQKIEEELADIHEKHKSAKRQAQKAADGSKAEFLRVAAVLQRRIDENAEEMQRLRDSMDRCRPELKESRERLNEQLKVQQERRAALQQERAERLAKIEAEIASLQPYESDSQFGQQ